MGDGSSLKSPSDEKNLLRHTCQGGTKRLADLISRYQPHVISIVSRRVSTDQVEEVGHDAFVRAYFSPGDYSGSGPSIIGLLVLPSEPVTISGGPRSGTKSPSASWLMNTIAGLIGC